MSRKEDRLLKKMEDDDREGRLDKFPSSAHRERNYLGEYNIPLPQRVPWNKYFEFSCDEESPYHVDQGGVGYCWMASVMLLLLNLKIPLNSRANRNGCAQIRRTERSKSANSSLASSSRAS